MESKFNIGETLRRNQKDTFGDFVYKDHFVLSKIEKGRCELNRVDKEKEEKKRIEQKEEVKCNSIFKFFFPSIKKNNLIEYDQTSPPIVCSVAQLNKLFEKIV